MPTQPLWLLRKGRWQQALTQCCCWVSGHPEWRGNSWRASKAWCQPSKGPSVILHPAVL